MNSDKIKWCIQQKKGLQLIDKKPHLSESYIKEADETLENMFVTKGKWKLITGYYACYNALYSILMKCGIKCEIHDCTIELMKLFEFNEVDIQFLSDLKTDRINTQYYLKDIKLKNEDKVKEFVLKCKEILNNLSSTKIENIRKYIGELLDSE